MTLRRLLAAASVAAALAAAWPASAAADEDTECPQGWTDTSVADMRFCSHPDHGARALQTAHDLHREHNEAAARSDIRRQWQQIDQSDVGGNDLHTANECRRLGACSLDEFWLTHKRWLEQQ